MAELQPTEAMLLDADGSGKGQWLTPQQIELYQTLYNARVAQPLGITGGE